LYEVLRSWTETGVTWNQALSGSPWSAPGAQGINQDRGTVVLGTLTSNGQEGFVTITLNATGIALVQRWIDDPSSNRGIIIQDYADTTNDGVSFDSSEATVAANRPKLTIVLAPAPAPTMSQPTPPLAVLASESFKRTEGTLIATRPTDLR